MFLTFIFNLCTEQDWNWFEIRRVECVRYNVESKTTFFYCLVTLYLCVSALNSEHMTESTQWLWGMLVNAESVGENLQKLLYCHTVPSHRLGGVVISLSKDNTSHRLVSSIIPIQQEGCLNTGGGSKTQEGRVRHKKTAWAQLGAKVSENKLISLSSSNRMQKQIGCSSTKSNLKTYTSCSDSNELQLLID